MVPVRASTRLDKLLLGDKTLFQLHTSTEFFLCRLRYRNRLSEQQTTEQLDSGRGHRRRTILGGRNELNSVPRWRRRQRQVPKAIHNGADGETLPAAGDANPADAPMRLLHIGLKD